MRHLRRGWLAFQFLPVCVLFQLPSEAAADGGTIRLSEQKGIYRITAFTSPTVLRAGPVDVSVLVQEAATGKLASGVQVIIKVVRRGSTGVAFHGPATTEAATNKLFYAAAFDFPESGSYSVEISIDGVLGTEQVRFELEAAEPLPSWLAMLPWVGWPVVVIALFGIHQLLVEFRSR